MSQACQSKCINSRASIHGNNWPKPGNIGLLSARVDCTFWAGGDISLATGNAIAAKTKLFTTCGSTEMGMWPTIRPGGEWSPEHWKYMRIYPATNVSFRHQSKDLYEALVERNSGIEYNQPIFKVLPTLQEFSSGDLFSPHPSDLDFAITVVVATTCKSSALEENVTLLLRSSD